MRRRQGFPKSWADTDEESSDLESLAESFVSIDPLDEKDSHDWTSLESVPLSIANHKKEKKYRIKKKQLLQHETENKLNASHLNIHKRTEIFNWNFEITLKSFVSFDQNQSFNSHINLPKRCDKMRFDPQQVTISQKFSRFQFRKRQINIGKQTRGYQNYIRIVPYESRKSTDPQTPSVYELCSKRNWDGQLRKWRRILHFYDSPQIGQPAKQLE